MKEEANVVPKVTPFKGINTDLLYIKDKESFIYKIYGYNRRFIYALRR
ncbi:hypothetical protein Q5M85_01545 [Paraclostridium bifermentans]|nr:hypothetical protein [Paraclostridium bifermentans]